MKIEVAQSAGFCFGVNRAVLSVYDHIEKKPLYTYGPIIHNHAVVEDLKKKGVQVIHDLEDIEDGTVVLRSHGVPLEIYDLLKNKDIPFIDATCPYVKRIHKKVHDFKEKGYDIVIIGNPDHPEVIGINGWCKNEGYIIDSEKSAKTTKIPQQNKICVVSQTTFEQEQFDNIIEILKDMGYNLTIFNTICNATQERQEETDNLSKCVDKMIIIGGKHSSNTQKLYHIAQSNCKNTFFVESADDLSGIQFCDEDHVGITAGASTPKKIIEEVIKKMTELQNNDNLSFEELLNESFVVIRTGEVVKGKIIHVNQDEIIVNVGYKSDGVIPYNEYTNLPNVDLQKEVKEGQEIEAEILRVDDREGHVHLSAKRVKLQNGFKKIEEVYESGDEISVLVTDVVRGGLIGIYEEVRVFIPASQVDVYFVNDLSAYKNEELEIRIIEYNPKRGKVIGSRKVILQKEVDEKRKEVLARIEVGDRIKGTVKRITSFGAFVDLGGMDGLLHISEMSWGTIRDPKKIVQVNDEVEVLVKDIDEKRNRISLSLKFPENNPWLDAEEKYKVGTVVTGKVVRLTDFGAFVELEKGVDALLHVSQISKEHVAQPSDRLKVGEAIEAQIMDLNLEEKKISLSIKALNEEQEDEKENKEIED